MKTSASHNNEFVSYNQIASRISGRDSDFIGTLMAELKEVQPFFTAGMMEFSKDLDAGESESMLTLYLVVWGVYRHYRACLENTITSGRFKMAHKRNSGMFSYLEVEDDNQLIDEVVNNDFCRFSNQNLMRYISHCFLSQPALVSMSTHNLSTSLINIKSFVECFDEIAREYA